MRILICFEGRVRPDSTGYYFYDALRSLGHEVLHIFPDGLDKIKDGYDLYIRCDDGLKQFGWNPNLHPSHYIAIDTHIETDWRLKLAEEGKFDTISVVHSEGTKLPWPKPAIWIPVGCDPEKHYAGVKEKIYDGCFIGNLHNGLAGPRIDMLDVFFRNCGKIFYGNRSPKHFPVIYAQTKIVFNKSINGDANMRFFEALCSGSCLVTDRVPDLDKLGFIDGVHYAGYSSGEELAIVTKELLSNDDKREKIASAGREFVQGHTYAKRMETLLEHTKGGVLCP